ncbi:hypothetical protein GCM10027277_20440 [Pseudoduganella ginsengisoli]|uniref:Uncharacterized protein n=1 Tax=Pseudoduganella ginsengisoli TaxID=1462440 RepID=A0A6L6PT79_9BURK|nr:hypothetical protein [Pseudoduganella ginsengisoli]MTW00700.1 hypothetical protein [Pseudoduganella ginsengisoli]
MNAAATPSLPLYPPSFVRFGKIGAALVGVLCASILFGLLVIGKQQSVAAQDSTLLLACFVQLIAVALQGQALGRSVSVLQVQRAPNALWQAWLRQWLQSVTRYWALLSIAVAVLMLTPGSPRHWLMAPALLSLLLCVGMVAVLARAGLLPRRLATVVEVSLAALLVYLMAASQFNRTLDNFAALPGFMLAACALAWPVMAGWIMHAQSDALRTVTGSQTNVLRRMRNALARWAGRYQPLRMFGADPDTHMLNPRVLLVVAMVQNLAFFAQLLPVQWGEQATPIRMARLMLVCMTCANALLVRDLHWRSLLLPGGTRLRYLGTRIVLSTMSFQAPVVILAALGSMLLAPHAGPGWHSLASVAIPLLELACCTSLMTLLRTLPRRLQVAGLLCQLLPMSYAYIPMWFKLDVPQATWQIGIGYTLLLAAVTCVAQLIANRRWTPKRLLEALTIA